ncbi:MAG: DNA/RNA nuclease SfsA [Cellvibrio sp.]
MKFYPATLLSRYKRFLSDVRLGDDQVITAHCPNTGSMRNCVAPESLCYLSHSDSRTRKYPYTIEVVTTPDGHLACINTGRANALVARAIDEGVITELQGYSVRLAEQKYGHEKSRIDWLLSGGLVDARPCYVEVKNLTLLEDGYGQFPDAVSLRGSKHLRELIALVEEGARAVLLFCVAHSGVAKVKPADHIDPIYGELLRQAAAQGVEVLAYQTQFDFEQNELVDIRLVRPVTVELMHSEI